jgi:hypothetical protein
MLKDDGGLRRAEVGGLLKTEKEAGGCEKNMR